MRFLVCGGRKFNDYNRLEHILNFYVGLPTDVIIHGGAQGADYLAGVWASVHGVPVEVYPAEWDKYGKSAGYIRNAKMLKEGRPHIVIAFPGGKGTKMMVELAKKAGVQIINLDTESN